jgi:uncharacterized damage-inducible protein DinB
MSADYFRTLWRYNCWANAKVLDKAALASEADYMASVPGLSFGSLHASLVHLLVADILWVARFRGEQVPKSLKEARRSGDVAATEVPTFARLLELWRAEEAKQASFFASLTDAGTEAVLHYENLLDQTNEDPMSQLLAHMFNHGTQFRTESSVRLTQLGLSPGDLDLFVYFRSGGT